MTSSVGSYDPWVIPLPSEIESLGDTMSLSPVELSYSAIHSAGESIDTAFGTYFTEKLDSYFLPQWDQPL